MSSLRFSGRLTTILTMVGVAIGLGNVWRFPYMMGQYGGSAFLFMYLVFALLIAVPAMSAEWALGRATRQGPIGAMAFAFGDRIGRPVGIALLAGILIADSYYIVVIANVAWTGGFSLIKGFSPETMSSYHASLSNGVLQYSISIIIAAAALFVVHKGLNRGIELVSRLFVPLFALVMFYLVFHTLTLPQAIPKVIEFLKPDFSRIGPREAFAAMGQAFYSVGLGGSIMVVYGSYLKDDANLPRDALLTVSSDAAAALMASLFIVPTVLVFGLDMSSGPGLIFSTMPELFSAMPGGRLAGSLFLLVLALVAFLSAIAAIEVFVSGLSDPRQYRWSRGQLVVVTFVLLALMMIPSALYPPFIGWADMVFGSGMLVGGGLIAIIALTRGLGRITTAQQIFPRRVGFFASVSLFWLRWVIPLALVVVLGTYLFSLTSGTEV